jgi:Short C-terminal domain
MMRRRGVGRGRPSLVGTAARTAVIAGTATAVSGKVAASQHQKAAAAEQQAAAEAAAAQAAAPPPPPAAPPASPPTAGGLTDDVVQQLRTLGELRDAGVLTEEEFAAKKAKILGI